MPPKRMATSPAPTRRTPRKSAGTSPARLGVGDNWGGAGKNSEWVSVDSAAQAKAEAEKVAAREVAVAEQNKKDVREDNAKKLKKYTKTYEGLMAKRPVLAGGTQGAIFAGLGELIASLIKGEPIAVDRVAAFTLWGFLLALVLQPYLRVLGKMKIFPKNKTLGSLGKTVVDQLTMTPLLTAAFLIYFKFFKEGMAMTGVGSYLQAEFVARYQLTALYWSCMNFANFALVPTSLQLLWTNVAGLVWGVIAAYII